MCKTLRAPLAAITAVWGSMPPQIRASTALLVSLALVALMIAAIVTRAKYLIRQAPAAAIIVLPGRFPTFRILFA